MQIDTGRWKGEELDEIIGKSSQIDDPGRRIAFISEQFLGISYQESTLIGDEHLPEDLVINLSGLDCFTLLDYVEALRMSGSFAEFTNSLKQVRYRDGIVSFKARNHFFTDWIDHNIAFVEDVTEQVGAGKVKRAQKILNLKEDGSVFIKGIEPVTRTITYVPAEALDETVMRNLRTGDYAGIYSALKGLDVSHVGIIIRNDGSACLRHATSAADLNRVLDQDFRRYMADKTGLIVLRPLKNE